MRKTLSSIDIAKFICCICIIAIHTNFLSIFPEKADYYIDKILLRTAVPFFFVVSGYFLGVKLIKQDKPAKDIIFSYCKRLSVPYSLFSIINIIEHSYTLLAEGKGFGHTVAVIVRSLIFYPFGALWFIWALIIGSLLLIPFLKSQRINLALGIGFFLYLIGLLFNNYYFLVDSTILQKAVDIYMILCNSARNGIFVGFFWLALGIKCSQIKAAPNFRRLWPPIIILFLSEIIFLYGKKQADDGSMLISHVIMAPMLLLTLINVKSLKIKEKTTIYMRNLSMGMYLLHKPVIYFVENTMGGGSLFIFAVLTTFIICVFFYETKLFNLDQLLK